VRISVVVFPAKGLGLSVFGSRVLANGELRDATYAAFRNWQIAPFNGGTFS